MMYSFNKQQPKTAIFTFGRMNPPTIAHEMLIAKILLISKEKKADAFLFVSQTQDKIRNPLNYKTKIYFLKKFFPSINLIDSPMNIIGLFDVLYYLEWLGYKHLIMISGGDRVSHYNEIVKKYIPSITPSVNSSSTINIKTFKVINAGNRNIGGTGLQGVSSTKARKYAINNNLELFLKITPNKNVKTQIELFHAVRNGVNNE